MERTVPRTDSDEIDLYVRTYYSLLRSSGEVLDRDAGRDTRGYGVSAFHLVRVVRHLTSQLSFTPRSGYHLASRTHA